MKLFIISFSFSFFSLRYLFLVTSFLQFCRVHTLGSSSTIAVTYTTASVCAIAALQPTHTIQCFQNGRAFPLQPNLSFEALSGGSSFFCGLLSGGLTLFCWDTSHASSFAPRRIYRGHSVRLTDLTVGDHHVCAREVNSGIAKCWRGRGRGSSAFPSPGMAFRFAALTSGAGFTCGILRYSGRVHCWGANDFGVEIQRQFANLTMLTLVAGKSHACGLTRRGLLVCKGQNGFGQLDVPVNSAHEFSGLGLGSDFSCAIQQRNGLVKCWGGADAVQLMSTSISRQVSFEFMVAGLDFACGLKTRNLSAFCWGSGWSTGNDLPLGTIVPGPCAQSQCSTCGLYPNSEVLCGGSGNICKSCQTELPIAVPLPPRMTPLSPQVPPLSSSLARNKYSLAFVVVGSVGVFAGTCTIVYCMYGLLRRRHHNIVQPSAANANENDAAIANYVTITPSLRSFSARHYSSRRFENSSQRLGRQISGSSSKYMDKTQKFLLSELVAATNNFSAQNKIGAGSFGSVYRGRLADGRQVAIKRGENGTKMKKFQEKENAFDSELALLSRLHHKHLVDLIGYCEEMDERLLVYEFMSNGALHDHLHSKTNVEKSSSVLNSWRMRIKIALDAVRGIEYLHNYAVPPIIHRDIKSSNILLDGNWTAKVSDFGLSLMGPDADQEFMSTKAAGTVGYIDPEYYVLNVLTAKSDVYGLGVVLLELLTGKKAVFRTEEAGAGPIGVVEYARPLISEGKLQRALDTRVGPPAATHEAEAVELMACTALRCVNLEGKERPNIVDLVCNLERALALCEESAARASSSTYSMHSD